MDWTVLVAIYFVPSAVAAYRRHNEAQVIVLNTFLGWTLIGWVVALVMAVGQKRDAPVAPRYDTRTGERLR